jgi:5-methylcytosine-specific restriction endonuclease McrA
VTSSSARGDLKLSTRVIRGRVVTLAAGTKLRTRPSGNAFAPTRRRIAERDGWTCALCRESIDPRLRKPHPRALAIHHVDGVANGGTDADENLRATHARCNEREG